MQNKLLMATIAPSLTPYLFGGSDTPDKRSMKGLPQPTMGSAEQFWDTAALKTLAMGTGTIEADLYRRSLEELQKISGALIEMKDQRQSAPTFR